MALVVDSRTMTATDALATDPAPSLLPALPVERLRVALERELTLALAQDPELERIVSALAVPDPRVVRRRLLGRALLLTESMAPELHASARYVARRFGLTRPVEIFQTHGDENAAIHAVKEPILVEVQGRLLTLLDEGSTRALLGHELGHYLAHGHGDEGGHVIIAAQLLASAEGVSTELKRKASLLSMAKELTADRFGLLACRDLAAALRLEMVATTGLPGSAITWDTEAYLAQSCAIVEATLADGEAALGVTHPEHSLRAYALSLFAESDLYREITGEGAGTRRIADVDATLAKVLGRREVDASSPMLEGAPREMHECALACSVFVALSDGDLKESEAMAIERVFAPKVPDFRWYLNLENAHQRFAEVGGVVAWAGEDVKRAMFHVLSHVVGADGEVTDPEVDMLVAIGDALGCGTLYRAMCLPLLEQFGLARRDLSSVKPALNLPPRPGEARDALRALLKGFRRRRGGEVSLRRLLRLVGEKTKTQAALALLGDEIERSGLSITPALDGADLDTLLVFSVGVDAAPASQESAAQAAGEARRAETSPQLGRLRAAVGRLRERLVSGDGRSPAIRLYGPRPGRTFDLFTLESLSVGLGERVLAKVRAREAAALLLASESGRHDAAKRLLAELVELDREARARAAETGAHDLYLGFPFLTGVVSGYLFRAPLLLCPVDLVRDERGARSFSLAPRADEPPIVNQALVRLLFRKREFAFPDDLASKLDAIAADPEGGPEALLRELRQLGVPATALSGALGELRDRSEELAAWKGDRFEVEECAVLGLFPQSASDLLQDYDELLSDLAKPDADVGRLLGAARELLPADLRDAFPAPDPEGTPPPPNAAPVTKGETSQPPAQPVVPVLGADPSQRDVLATARTARALVVDGPPGTGKSQVIVNLIVDALGRDERVAVVCEKRAALDVVAQRLESAGFGHVLALVHDVHEDRRSVYAKVAARLDVERQRHAGDDGHVAVMGELARVTAALDERVAVLAHRPSAGPGAPSCGMSIGQLHALASGIAAPALTTGDAPEVDLSLVGDADLARLCHHLCSTRPYLDLIAEGAPFRGPGSIAARPSLHEASEEKLRAMASELAAAADAARAAERLVATIGAPPEALEKARVALDAAHASREKRAASPEAFLRAVRAASDPERRSRVLDAIERAEAASAEHGDAAREVSAPVRWEPRPDFERALGVLLVWVGRFLRFFIFAWWRSRGVVRGYLATAWPEEAASPLDASFLRRARARLGASKLWMSVDALAESAGLGARSLRDTPGALAVIGALGATRDDIAKIARGKDALGAIGAFPDHDPEDDEATARWDARVDACREALDACRAHQRAAAPVRAALPWIGERPGSAELSRVRAAWDAGALRIVELDRRRANARGVTPDADRILDLLLARGPQADAGAWCDALAHEWALAWIRRAERAVPGIAALDRGTAFGDDEAAAAELRRLVAEAARGERARVLARLDHGALLTTEPAMKRKRRTADQAAREAMLKECRKQRSILPLRSFAREFAPKGLLEIVPVWLLSPETMAVIFPRQPLFNVVIVDEASQCTVEGGLPALLRGHRVVVSGDEKQMPPTSFFTSALEVEPEPETHALDEAETLDAESLLTLARARVEHAGLLWHYRCREEELIAFSNHAMYGGALLTVPSIATRKAAPALRWIEVPDGSYEAGRNTNEARRVVDVVEERLARRDAKGRAPSVGVVTFNLQQRRAILDEIDARKLRDEAFAAAWAQAETSERVEERPFVKNLENVQGDERDVIVFSLGHAPLERRARSRVGGKTEETVERYVPSRFGPLGLAGGERRLNVAISRAKEECVVVASFEPEMLTVAQTKNDGPKLFKLFLEFARHLSKNQRKKAETVLDVVRDGAVAGARAPASGAGARFPSAFVSLAAQIANELADRGFTCDLDVGSSEFRVPIAVVDPRNDARYALAIFADEGATAASAFEHHVHAPAVLAQRGWMVERISARAYHKNPTAELERLTRRLPA